MKADPKRIALVRRSQYRRDGRVVYCLEVNGKTVASRATGPFTDREVEDLQRRFDHGS